MSNCGCKKTPCGCKTTSAIAVTGGCGCGGGGCAVCEPRAFIRPRFFAGQLLTEDDLALLGDYVVSKNRLHNRALWGPGVVCGLDVHCDPCSPGSVVVEPGYAINCCGDDIVVPCPETVDILALIRDLKQHNLGAECADPCEQPRLTTNAAGVANPKAPIRSYYLYVRYAEQLTDPVSPYATDEPCAGMACEPTRVREGHTYELRCTDDNPQFPGLGDRVLKCSGDVAVTTNTTRTATTLTRIAVRAEAAERALALSPQPTFLAADIPALRTGTSDLTRTLATLATPEEVAAAVEATRVAGSLFGRLAMTPREQRPQVETEPTHAALLSAVRVLPPAIKAMELPALDAAEAHAILALAREFADVGANLPALAYNQRLWAYGAAIDPPLLEAAAAAHASIRSYLAPKLQDARRPNDCQLLAQFEGLRSIEVGAVTPVSVNSLSTNGSLAGQVLGRFIFECICDAFNPPCQTCDDPAVLLAEICVQDCVVVDICEMVRRFVITWPSMRYWTAFQGSPMPLNLIGQFVEALCCNVRGRLGPCGGGDIGRTMSLVASNPMSMTALTRLSPTLSTSALMTDASPLGELGSLLSHIGPLATATAVVPGGASSMLDPAIERTIESRVSTAVTAALATHETALAELRAEVARLSTPEASIVMAELIQRPRFFEGQVLGSTDLTAGLEYARSQEARHDRLVHSWGIADGLSLVKIEQPDGTSIVRLRAGMAIDGTGREIVVPQDVTLDEKLFVRTNVVVGDVEALYPVMLAGADSPALPRAVGRSCTAAQASRTVESYKLAFGAPGDERTIELQKAPTVDQGAGGAPNQPRWWILLGFVRWDASLRKFTGLAYRSNTAGRRYVGIRADEVTAQGGALVLRSRPPGHPRRPTLTLEETLLGGKVSLGLDDGNGTSLPMLTADADGTIEGNAGQLALRSGAARVVGKPMIALAETAAGGTLTFGLQDASGKPSPLMSVDELGNLSIAGLFNGLVAGGVKVASGIATDGLVIPLPDGVTEAHVAAGTVALHILVVPRAPGAAPYDANLSTHPHWIGRPLSASVDADRRLTCRIHWLGFHASGGAPLAENLGGACDYLVLAVGQGATP